MHEPYVHKIFIRKGKQMESDQTTDQMAETGGKVLFKEETDDVWLGKTGLREDEVTNQTSNQQLERALFAYPIKHYTYWKHDVKVDSIALGDMGEHLAVLEMDEFSVCIGDTYRLGDAVIQVSQPYQPSWKLARRFGIKDFALNILTSGRTGWYFRVLQEGHVLSKADIELIERPYPQWTIAACNEVMYIFRDHLRLADELASCHLLAKSWRQALRNRLRGKEPLHERGLFRFNHK
ncbi:MAG TPA: MOSC domain-containing protein [Bacillota bacterium]